MSQTEINRFVSDVQGSDDLQAALNASGGDVDSIVNLAVGKGYDISVDEARDYLKKQAEGDLSDEDLDGVAGGKTSSVSVSTGDIEVT